MHSRIKHLFGAAALVATCALVATSTSGAASAADGPHHHGHGVRGGLQTDPVIGRAGPAATIKGSGIDYHGGAVMKGTVKTYIIWYGNWTTSTNGPLKKQILTDLLTNIGGTPYFNINQTYYDQVGTTITPVSGLTTLAGQVDDAYSQGKKNLSDTAIQKIVTKAITGGLPADPNAVYFVFTSSDVTKSGFLTSYCGWHTHATISAKDIKFSFVGDPSGPKLGNCAMQTAKSPNGDPGADAMASVVAHELEEAVTDPDLNAWYDSTGAENADKCAWTFGTTLTATNGSLYNLTIGSRQYLIQRNWVNSGAGYCALA